MKYMIDNPGPSTSGSSNNPPSLFSTLLSQLSSILTPATSLPSLMLTNTNGEQSPFAEKKLPSGAQISGIRI
jgi:hypothetical protein